MTLSSKVTITNGDYGTRISGIDSKKTGDLKIDETKGWGQVLDTVVSDGNVLHENPAGKGFLAIDQGGQIRAVDQTYINETDLKKGGVSKQPDAMQELFRVFSSLLSMHHAGCFTRDLLGSTPNQNTTRWAGGSPNWQRDNPGEIVTGQAPLDGTVWPGGSPPWVFDEAIGGPNPRYLTPVNDQHFNGTTGGANLENPVLVHDHQWDFPARSPAFTVGPVSHCI